MGSIRQAVIVMAKRPQAGQTKTRLCPPFTPEQAALLAEVFLRDTVTNLQRADCAEVVLAYTPLEAEDWFAAQFPGLARISQPDGDLGTRMNAVLEAAWRLRYQPCVLVGADSPDLPAETLRAAFDALRPGPEGSDLVLGPAEDGGYYLLGLKGRQPSLFESIAWSTEHVFAQTLERAHALNLRVRQLPLWYDLDTPADLDRLRARLATAPPETCPATRRII
ncbi:MAG TPA: TIGR04282 family arsenosugar biosynthesis glycosyltransferase [Chthonomonadaceae bacterium]|nr:TIGR04282 family arsenosugar biosynthesis glycosyltransferase [Chthonomonadaceae bacterium]